MQTLGEKQQTLATLDMSMHEIEDVDMHVQVYNSVRNVHRLYNYAWFLLIHVQD